MVAWKTTRRAVLLASGGTVAAGVFARKSHAGESRAFADALVSDVTKALPPIGITDATGAAKTLADFAGKPALLNLWATWCTPCVAEMPDLDRLAKVLAGEWAVLPLSSDRSGAPVVQAFYTSHDIAHLPVLLDRNGEVMHSLAVRGIPTTIVVGADGRERGRLEGAVEWTAPESISKLRAMVG